MKISELKNYLQSSTDLDIELPNGTLIPAHFHITEMGIITKHFIDCGGTERTEKVANLQVWTAKDLDHRLAPQKLLGIIELSEKVLGHEDLDIEIEYQGETIGKYGLSIHGSKLQFQTKFTDCLASEACGIPAQKKKIELSQLGKETSSCCTPGGACC